MPLLEVPLLAFILHCSTPTPHKALHSTKISINFIAISYPQQPQKQQAYHNTWQNDKTSTAKAFHFTRTHNLQNLPESLMSPLTALLKSWCDTQNPNLHLPNSNQASPNFTKFQSPHFWSHMLLMPVLFHGP